MDKIGKKRRPFYKKRQLPFYKKKWFWITFSFLFLLLITVGLYGYWVWTAANKAFEPPKNPNLDKKIATTPFSFLLLGVDEHPGDVGRSDTMIVATLNPHQKNMILTSIPRDTYVSIPGIETKTKINHSYSYGGVELTRQTVQKWLNIPIDKYVKINMIALEKIVDALGGIEVNVPFDFTYLNMHFKKGKMRLNGKQALGFARMRKEDPQGDLGRTRRQQEVIRAIVDKITEFSSVLKLYTIIDQLGSNIKTDISPMTLFDIQQIYGNMGQESIETVLFTGGTGKIIQGVYYYLIPSVEIKRVHDLLMNHLELPYSPAQPTLPAQP